MALQITRARAEHLPALSRIVFEAFRCIQEQHRFPVDIPEEAVARHLLEMFIHRPDFYGVVALAEGKVVGSCFTQVSDPVSGVGPVTVDPAQQERGIGRAMMRHIIDWSLENHGPMVRLVQESFNLRSLSLYTSLGFDVMEPLILMDVKPAEAADASVRPLVTDDLNACDALCRRVLKVSRHNELAFMIEHGGQSGFMPHGRFRGAKLVAYVIPGFLGHSVGESAEDLLTVVTQAARVTPPPAHRLFIPTRNGDLLRRVLKLGMRCLKPLALMAMGPYEQPLGSESGAAWTPSIAY